MRSDREIKGFYFGPKTLIQCSFLSITTPREPTPGASVAFLQRLDEILANCKVTLLGRDCVEFSCRITDQVSCLRVAGALWNGVERTA